MVCICHASKDTKEHLPAWFVPGTAKILSPYDVSAELVARQAGVIITDAFGDPLECPLDVRSAVHWCGYSNQTLADQIAPIIKSWLLEHDITAD